MNDNDFLGMATVVLIAAVAAVFIIGEVAGCERHSNQISYKLALQRERIEMNMVRAGFVRRYVGDRWYNSRLEWVRIDQ